MRLASLLPDRHWNSRVWRIAAPIILANATMPLPGIIDTAVMGQLPDPAYIGAVAIGSVIFSFVLWGLGFLRMATTGFTAQAFGAEDQLEIRASLLRPMMLALLLGFLIIALQRPLGELAFWAFAASEDVENLARIYFDIRIWAAPATLINIVVIGWLLGLQHARTTMIVQIVLNLVNICLDFLFVLVFDMGVEGVALATLIAEYTAAALGLSLVYRFLRKEGRWLPGERLFDWPSLLTPSKLLQMARVNGDIFLRTFCLLFGFAVFTSESGKMGDVTLAANAVLQQFLTFSAFVLDGFAHSAEVLVGAEMGRKNLKNFRAAVVASAFLSGLLSLMIAIGFLVFGLLAISLMTTNGEVREMAAVFLIWAALQPLVGVAPFLLDGIFIGTTRSAALRNAMLLSLAGYLAILWLAVPLWGNHGLWLALSCFMVLRGITLGACYPALERSIEG